MLGKCPIPPHPEGWGLLLQMLKNDGTVWVCGYYKYGSGANNNRNVTKLEQVQGLSSIKAISAGYGHYLAVDKDGNVWAWGMNTNGQLGVDNVKKSAQPVRVSGISDVKAVCAAYQFSLALKNDGTVWAWGWNKDGALGTGQGSGSSKKPVQVPGLSDIIAIEASSESATALKRDGTIYVWGYNPPGAWLTGKGSNVLYTPEALQYVEKATSFAADNGVVLLTVHDNGTVWGFGPSLNYRDPETGLLYTSTKPVQIKFMVSQASATVPTTQASATVPTTKQTPALPLWLAMGALGAAAILRSGKK